MWLARLVSLTFLTIFVATFFVGFFANPWRHYLSVSNSLHIGVWNRGLDSRIVIFNNAAYGPYRGSVVGFAGDDGNSIPLVREQGFGDTWGIYYRNFEWPSSALWTLMISIWYPIATFGIITVVLLAYPRRWIQTKIAQ